MKPVALIVFFFASVGCSLFEDEDYPHDTYCHEDGGEWNHDRHCCEGPVPSKYDIPC